MIFDGKASDGTVLLRVPIGIPASALRLSPEMLSARPIETVPDMRPLRPRQMLAPCLVAGAVAGRDAVADLKEPIGIREAVLADLHVPIPIPPKPRDGLGIPSRWVNLLSLR